MRKVIEQQMQLDETDVSQIKIDIKSRDEIPKLLIGLQYIYCNPELRKEVFNIIEEIVPDGVNTKNGRPGMNLWKILVLGTVRLNCNWDYDKLREIANNHRTLRQMLGHGIMDDDYMYPFQTLKDNISLFTPEVLERINAVVVKAGHKLIGKKKEEDIKGRCDSYVVETDVHYPTDINLLFDAIRKVITLIARLSDVIGISDWRQSRHNIKKIKKLLYKAQNLKRSTSKDEKKKEKRNKEIKEAHKKYIKEAKSIIEKAKGTIKNVKDGELITAAMIMEIEKYIGHAERQIEQITRRVLHEETIPQNEKVYSIFEEHTEWIRKGKAGVSQELGLRVCIVEDKYGYILHHKVMQKQTDDKIAVSIVQEAQERYSDLKSCSFDKGFYSPGNKEELKKILDRVILPKKGKLSLIDKEEEYSNEFVQSRKQHSAVESAINALENHGLDRCPDNGIKGFKRYVAIAVLARNIQILGNAIQQKELKRQQKRERLKKKRQHLLAA